MVKFAWKHRSPINRSAFTYWEEEIPSRIDLAKSRYGGPFSIEQVEDVKTFFRLLVVLLPVFITSFAINLYGPLHSVVKPLPIPKLFNDSTTPNCFYHLFSKFTYNPWWCCMVITLLYKFTFYLFPILRHKLGSCMLRKGVILFTVAIFNISLSIYNVVALQLGYQVSLWALMVFTIVSFGSFGLLVMFTVEFMSAQSPYSMRGLLSGIAFLGIFVFNFLGYVTSLLFDHLCQTNLCVMSQYSIGALLSIVGFLLHLVIACWYKRRVRDEEYNLHHQVEQVYNAYLSPNNRQH